MPVLSRVLGRRSGPETMRQYESDKELAGRYEELRSGAAVAERALRDAQARGRPLAEVRERNEALDHALGAALAAALAGERAAMGPKAYDDRIARRRATVRADVRTWTYEVSKLRTIRESFRLEAMSRTGTLIPIHVQVGSYAMSPPSVPSAEPGQPEGAAEELGGRRIGVDLDEVIGEQPARG